MKRGLLVSPLRLFCAAPPVLGQAAEYAESVPDGSVLLSPQALSGIGESLRLLEGSLGKRRRLLTSLSGELSVAESLLTTLKELYSEQRLLVMSLRVWADQPGERLSASDQSLPWAMEGAALMEAELSQARTLNTRLDRGARFRRTPAIVAGALALGAGVAAVVWQERLSKMSAPREALICFLSGACRVSASVGTHQHPLGRLVPDIA